MSSITVGPGLDLHAGSLLHEQISVKVSALVKGKQKEYDWIAKIHRREHDSANYARFQVSLIALIYFSHAEYYYNYNSNNRFICMLILFIL